MIKKTQDDHVKELKDKEYSLVVNKVRVPGIETLHNKSREDICIALSNVLKTQPNIKELRWVIGEYVELTSEPLR